LQSVTDVAQTSLGGSLAVLTPQEQNKNIGQEAIAKRSTVYDESDIDRVARQLIRQHGNGAARRAAEMVREQGGTGNQTGAMWAAAVGTNSACLEYSPRNRPRLSAAVRTESGRSSGLAVLARMDEA
jgi:hypothetical protein